MIYCRRCLYPSNHPLGITFDDAGICSGCRVHEEKDALDWGERGGKLAGLFDSYRDRTGRNFDCIVPVSGAKDSYFIVHTVKKVYGMNPLLVTFNKEYNTRRGIRNLAYLRTLFDCDHMTYSPSPELLKKIMRKSLVLRGSVYWHCLAGTSTFPVQAAVRLGVPLIVWGVHQGVDQVGMFSHLEEVEMTEKYRREHDLMGLDAGDFVDPAAGISEAAAEPFRYPSDEELERVGVRGIYLGNYIRWDAKRQHEEMIRLYGYESAEQERTFNTYEDVDCFHYSGLHDWIKYAKSGYGKVTDHATREIRLRRMTREEGIDLVARYQYREPVDISLFLRWAGMTREELLAAVDRHRDPAIWERDTRGEWRLRDSILNHRDDTGVEEAALELRRDIPYQVSPSRDSAAVEDRYVIVARGFVDGRE